MKDEWKRKTAVLRPAHAWGKTLDHDYLRLPEAHVHHCYACNHDWECTDIECWPGPQRMHRVFEGRKATEK